MKDKWNSFKKWFKNEVWQKENIVYFLIAELIFWSPVIFCSIMAIFNSWWWAGVIAVIGFWAGPFTPAVPLQIGLMFTLKKIHKKVRLKSSNMKIDFEADNIPIWTKEYLEAVLKQYKAEELLDGQRKLISERKINKAFRKIAIYIKKDFIKEMKKNTKKYIKKQNFEKIENLLNIKK